MSGTWVLGRSSSFATTTLSPTTRNETGDLLLRCRWGRGWGRGLRLRRRRLHSVQHGVRAGALGGVNGKRDRRHHENDGRPGRRFRQCCSGSARSKGSLAAHSAKRRCDIAALAALQEHHNDQKEGNNNVNDGDENNHGKLKITLKCRLGCPLSCVEWCGRGDLNPHAFRRHPLKMVCLPVPPLPHDLYFQRSTAQRTTAHALLARLG